ncbi:hypothetical protein [Agromyces seonyuensis]|nr:hypothetical protein [Agromyces seonyuensis]
MGTRERTRTRRAPAIIGWALLAALLVGAFFASFWALNRTVYGAGQFVDRYLSAIARDDIAAAVATPGVDVTTSQLEALGVPADTSRAMLRSGVVAEAPEDVEIVDDVANDDGTHTVSVSYRIGDSILENSFLVQPIDPLYGVLHRWAFAVSPLAVVQVDVQHGYSFEVGDLTLDARAAKTGEDLAAFTQSAPYLVVAPAGYVFESSTTLVSANDEEYTAEPATKGAVALDLQPTPEFVDRVQEQVEAYLVDECTSQQVLQPTGCPFGAQIDDRVIGDPTWTIASMPTVTLTAGEDAFVMPPTEGVAHLSVLVQSLFDGTTEQQESDHPFDLALSATINADGGIEVQLQ